MWVLMHDKLPVKSRLMRFIDKIADQACVLCNAEVEDSDHIFFSMHIGIGNVANHKEMVAQYYKHLEQRSFYTVPC